MAEGNYNPELGRMRAAAQAQRPNLGHNDPGELPESQGEGSSAVDASDLPQHRFSNWPQIRKLIRGEFSSREAEEIARREAAGLRGSGWRDEMEDQSKFHNFVAQIFVDNPQLSIHKQDYVDIINHLYNEFYWYGALTSFLRDPQVEDIILDNYHWMDVVRGGRRQVVSPTPFSSDDEVFEWLQVVIFEPRGKHFSRSQPLQSAILRDGSRLYAFTDPVSPFTGFALRRHKRSFQGAEGVRRYRDESKVAPREFFDQVVEWVQQGRNIVISGATGSGKTTLLNWAASQIPAHERIITLEDTPELSIEHRRVKQMWTSSVEARAVHTGEADGIDMSALLRACLRLAPKRIVVGEVRGKEALDMLEAMNTGHNGSFTTLHANSPGDAVVRLETMAMKGEHQLPLSFIQLMIASAVDVIVQIVNLPAVGRRVVGIEQVLARHHYNALKYASAEDLQRAGIYQMTDQLFLRQLWRYESSTDRLLKVAEFWNPDYEVEGSEPVDPARVGERRRREPAPPTEPAPRASGPALTPGQEAAPLGGEAGKAG